jgi:long-subunit fatty acid transport protein
MSKRPLCLLALLALLPATEARAAAWYLGEFGPRAIGRGGAIMVNPGDPSAMWLNPAAITNAHGLQLQLDGTLVFMDASFARDCGPGGSCGPIDVERDYGDGRSYRVTSNRAAPSDNPNDPQAFEPTANNLGKFRGPSSFADGRVVQNQAPFQPIPRIWATLNLDTFGLEGVAVGAGIYAPQAGAYAFGEEEYTRYSLISRDVREVYYGFTLAYRYKNWIAVGASLQGVSAGVNQTLKMSADLYGNEDPEYDIGVNINVTQHFIPSANFGVWSMPLPGLELGGSIQLGRSVQASGPVALTFGPGVQELINGGTVAIAQNDPRALTAFELPPIYRAGVKYGMQDLWEGLFGFELELNFVYEAWSSYDHIYLATSGIDISTAGNPAEPLPAVVQPKDFKDSFSVRLGGEVDFFKEMLALRSGVYYETDAIPNETYSIELLNGQQVGVGVGASVKLYGVRVDVGYAHVFMFDRTIGNESIVHVESAAPPLFNPEPRTRNAMGAYRTSYDIVSVGLNITFDEMFGIGHYAALKPATSELPLDEAPATDPAPADDVAPAASDEDEPLPTLALRGWGL